MTGPAMSETLEENRTPLFSLTHPADLWASISSARLISRATALRKPIRSKTVILTLLPSSTTGLPTSGDIQWGPNVVDCVDTPNPRIKARADADGDIQGVLISDFAPLRMKSEPGHLPGETRGNRPLGPAASAFSVTRTCQYAGKQNTDYRPTNGNRPSLRRCSGASRKRAGRPS